jgi:hypothetical protein
MNSKFDIPSPTCHSGGDVPRLPSGRDIHNSIIIESLYIELRKTALSLPAGRLSLSGSIMLIEPKHLGEYRIMNTE